MIAADLEEIRDCFESEAAPSEVINLPFGEAIWPWIGAARKRLQEKAGRQFYLLSPEALFALEMALLRRWSHYCSPSMAVELGIRRYQSPLEGKDSQERYQTFVRERFLDREAIFSFLEEYKELSRTVVVLLDLWIAQVSEFLQRFEDDLSMLENHFNNGQSFGKIVALEPQAGDFHNGGRSVYILQFENEKKLVYKPKDLSIVSAFNGFIDVLNHLGISLQLKAHRVLPRGKYGWEEFIEQKACENREQVGNYFKRAGMLLCLMYLLDGNDVHYENLIAYGEHPIIIDLETLFHLDPPSSQFHSPSAIDDFVLKAGMLPTFIFGYVGKRGIDMSSLGAEAGEPYPLPIVKWCNKGTDEMHLVHESGLSKESNHRVIYEGKKIAASEYVDDIVKGFREMYTLLIQHCSHLLASDSALCKMAHCPVRFILRGTRFYYYILRCLSDPQLILNTELINQELNVLFHFLTEKGKEHLSPLVEEEKKALMQGDIPFFTAIPAQRHLFSGNRKVVEDAFELTPFERVCQRLKKLNAADCALQETYIRQSFFIKTSSAHLNEKCESPLRLTPLPMSKDAQRQKIIDIAQMLKNRAIRFNEEQLGWIDLELDPVSEQYSLRQISDNLYGGRLGIALFFAALFHSFGDVQWQQAALMCLAELRRNISEKEVGYLIAGQGVGGMGGIGSVIYVLMHCGKLLNEPKLIEEASNVISAIEERHILEDKIYDVVGGCAGLLLSLLTFHSTYPNPQALKLAILCGEHLCQSYSQAEVGVVWKNIDHTPFLGFSHGTAGIAYALLRLANVQQNDSYVEVAQRAMEYERSLFSPEKNNWPRLGKIPITYPVAWCHGATGIGFGRLATLSFCDTPQIREEIETALETTKTYLFADMKPSLCCGSLGQLELLIEAAKVLNKPELRTLVDEAIPTLFAQIKQAEVTEFYKPGFMQGAAGIGYTLLRLLDKRDSLPQVLLLN